MPAAPISIVDPADPRIAPYRLLSDSALLQSQGLFIAEGRLVVRRLIESGGWAVRSLLVNPAAAASLQSAFALLDEAVPIYVCETRDFLGVTGHDIHRGCLALVERPPARRVADVLATSDRATALPRVVVVLEGVTNADNVGGVFRNAAAFGAGAVLLSPTCCDPLYRKAIRTSMAATLFVPYARVDSWPGGLDALRMHGYTIVALTPREPSVTLEAFAATARPARVALLVGTEGEGLTAAVEDAADVRVRIPISTRVDSLNLSVATGIALNRMYSGSW